MNDEPRPVYITAVTRRQLRKPVLEPIKGPEDVYALIRPLVADAQCEHFYAVYLNARHVVIEIRLISMGSLNASIVHPREVFQPGIALSAATMIVAHNHPSGVTDPSDDDRALTRRLVQVGELVGIAVLDHLIVANGSFTSFKQAGYL